MTLCAWLVVAFSTFALAMKRTCSNKAGIDATIESSENRYDLFGLLPLEVLKCVMLPFMRSSSILVMSMTSKTNLNLFTILFSSAIDTEKNNLVEGFFESAYGDRKSPEYYMMKARMNGAWSTSTDCLLRFRLRDMNYALIQKANNLPRSSVYPVFFPVEQDMPYVQVPETGCFGWSALVRRAFKVYVFNADLLKELPTNIISDLNLSEGYYLDSDGDTNCESLVCDRELLDKLDEGDLIKYFCKTNTSLFKFLLKSGLDAISSDEDEDKDEPIDIDVCTLELMIHQTTDKNVHKLRKLLNRIEVTEIQDYAYILCRADLDFETILEPLYNDETLDGLLVYALLLSNGWTLTIGFFTHFYTPDEIYDILDSYSDGEFTIGRYDDEPAIEDILFLAVCREESDDLIMALIRRSRIRKPIGAFFFLLLSGRSASLISYFLVNQKGYWATSYAKNIPVNVDIPHSLLPEIMAHLGRFLQLGELIPNPEKYVSAIKYLADNNLWTDRVSLLSVVQDAVRNPCPYVLQSILDIATSTDFINFAKEPIFTPSTGTCGMAMQRLPVMEYLTELPIEKLVELIESVGPQNPDILDPTLDGPLQASMLPLIVRIVFAHPQASVHFVQPDQRPIFNALINEAWENLFPGAPSPTTNFRLVTPSFFMLVAKLVRENLKAAAIIYPITICAFSAASKYSDFTEYPESFTFRQKTMAMKILKEVSASADNTILIKCLAANQDRIKSPFTEASFRELIRRPSGLIRIMEAQIMDNNKLLELMKVFLPNECLTEDLIKAIQSGTISDTSCPWLQTGIDTFNI